MNKTDKFFHEVSHQYLLLLVFYLLFKADRILEGVLVCIIMNVLAIGFVAISAYFKGKK